MLFETARLKLRKLVREDYEELCEILQDIEIMYAWEHEFSDEEVIEWIEKNIERYEKHGFSYLAAIEKDTNKFVGVMGPLVETIEEREEIGIAYILNKKYWKKGYAVEGVSASIKYAFDVLKAKKVIAQIRPSNENSIKVAKSLGMKLESEYVKHYMEKEMIHYIYSIEKDGEKNAD